MKYYNIAAAVCAAIGVILVFVGWDMGNGHFWGKTYEKGNFAYAIVSKDEYFENDIIRKESIENIFVWIPAFYYDEKKNIISLPVPSWGVDNTKLQKTTAKYILHAFFYMNQDVYGFWLQLDKNNIDKITNGSAVNIHKITEDEIFAINLLKINNKSIIGFNNIDDAYVISIGKGNFFSFKSFGII